MPQQRIGSVFMIQGKKLLDQIVVPAGVLSVNQSYARVSDAAEEWEVKGGSPEKYVTQVQTTRPSTVMQRWKNSKNMTASASVWLFLL